MKAEQLVEKLNGGDMLSRLDALKKLKEMIDEGTLDKPAVGKSANNHIHTIYSFSPYSPTKAVWMAYRAGLQTAGIMDHDSVSGALEFIKAGEIIGLATTVGIECRVDMSKTRVAGRRINNPDQDDVAYIALHGIPHTQLNRVRTSFGPYTIFRNERNRRMIENINGLFEDKGITLDFDADVVPLSERALGGSITERHILFALAKKIVASCGKSEKVVSFLRDFGVPLSEKAVAQLSDTENVHYEYDLLGVLKSDLIEKIYVNATDECPDVRQVLQLGHDVGAICAYAYLGDVGDSVTGDKKTQKFEDDYLDLLFEEIKSLGFDAVTYMPTRNTSAQLTRLKELCKKHDLFEISGEDINSPRQQFVCPALEKPEFQNLIESTWALIGHEKAATENLSDAMFSKSTKEKFPDLTMRTEHYAKIGRGK